MRISTPRDVPGLNSREASGGRWRGRILRTVGLAMILVVLVAPSLFGQEGGDLPPLRKSDVVVMLTTSDLSQDQIASAIRSRCLTFEPTETDLNDFRRVGAEDVVIQAVRECERQTGETPAPQQTPPAEQTPPAGEPASPPSLSLVETGFAPGGGEQVRVRVSRDGEPVAGELAILLVRPPAAPEVRILDRGQSGSDGRITFQVPAGAVADSYVVRLAGPPPGEASDLVVDGLLARLAAMPISLSPMTAGPGMSLMALDTVPVAPGTAAEGTGGLVSTMAPGEPETTAGGERDTSRARAGETVIQFEDPEAPGERDEPEAAAPATGERGTDVASLARRAESYRRAGELYLARKTLRSAVRRGSADTALQRRLWDLRNVEALTWFEGTVMGGGSGGDEDFRSGAGLQTVEARISPVPGTLTLWYRFDDGLYMRKSELIRGPTMYRSHFGGVSVRYPGSNMETRASVGRRKQPPRPFRETTVSLDHTFLLGSRTVPDFERIQVGLGGTWGRWGSSVEHDLFLRAFAGFPVTPIFRTEVTAHYSESIGTVPSTEGWRSRAREIRLEVTPVIRSGDSRLAVGLSYGDVEAVPDEVLGREEGDPRFSGSLWNVQGHGTLPLSRNLRLEGFARWQSAPGFPSFTVFGLGVSAGVPY